MIERDKSIREPRLPDDAPTGAAAARPSEEHLLKPTEKEKPKARGSETEAASGAADDADTR